MDRASVFVWQFQDALSTTQHISRNISTKKIFDLSQWQQNHNTTTDKKAAISAYTLATFRWDLPLSQWLWRKSTSWFLSRCMRRHYFFAIDLKRGVGCHALVRPDSFQNKLYGPTLNSMKKSTANPKESFLKFAHPSLYVSKMKSAISKLSWLLVEKIEGTKSI